MLGGSIGMLGARVRTSELALARSETWRSGHACAIFVWASGHDAFNPDQFTNVKPGMLPSHPSSKKGLPVEPRGDATRSRLRPER